MKYILVWLLFFPIFTQAQESLNMTLLSNWDLPNLPVRFGAEYNDCWGYRAPNGTEVAIIGGIEDIFFVNITNPANPVLIHTHHVENLNGTDNQSLWRDFKSYSHYVYACADEEDSGLLIFDLAGVPSTVTLVNQTNAFWSTAHNIFIDVPNGRLYAAGTNTQSNGLKILNLASTPANPTLLASVPLNVFNGGYVHDVHVRNNIAYCSHGGLSKLHIYDMTNLSNISLEGIIDNYPEEGYNHSSWVNEAGNMLVMADETQGSDLKLIDISDPANISNDDIWTFFSELEGASAPGASVAHNPFIEGDLAYIAYYHDGIQVFDISNPQDIQLLAFYDTYPQNDDYVGYEGAWGVYPYFPSGNIIGSDQTNGLFVMEIISEILDINFLSFEASRKNQDIQLTWSVSDASFGNRFEVKRSSDNGKTFENLGTTPLLSNESHYSFLDENVTVSTNYLYRIDFVELDGNKISSPLRSITSGNGLATVRVINPMDGKLVIDLLEPVHHLELQLFDLDGSLIWSSVEEKPKARMEKDVTGLVAGSYLLTANWEGGSENVILQNIR